MTRRSDRTEAKDVVYGVVNTESYPPPKRPDTADPDLRELQGRSTPLRRTRLLQIQGLLCLRHEQGDQGQKRFVAGRP
jgi:hypothetical protein